MEGEDAFHLFHVVYRWPGMRVSLAAMDVVHQVFQSNGNALAMAALQ